MEKIVSRSQHYINRRKSTSNAINNFKQQGALQELLIDFNSINQKQK